MAIKRPVWLCLFLPFIVSMADTAFGAAAGRTFPFLTIGFTTYTNVTITDVSGGSIFLRHSRGFESLRIDSVDPRTLAELGIQAPAARPARKADSGANLTAPAYAPSEPAQVEPTAARSWEKFGKPPVPEGVPGMILISLSIVGILLVFAGWVLFVLSAFRSGPWWGLGVFFGGLTCGIVPFIYFVTHFEESRKAFFCTAGGLVVCMLSSIVSVNLERTKAAVKARPRAMLMQ